jgi:hypothetical protein
MEKLNQLIDATIAEAIKCMNEGKFEPKTDSAGDFFTKDNVTIRQFYGGDQASVVFYKLVDIDEATVKFMESTKKERLQQQLEELKDKQTKVEQQLAELN